MKCRCGKVWAASERDARDTLALEARLAGKSVERELGRCRFYECEEEPGVWHWTRRGEWLPDGEFAEKEKAKCKCAGVKPLFGSEVGEMRRKLVKVDGLHIRKYKCPRSDKVFHLEYVFDGVEDVDDRCRKVYYKRGLKQYKKVIAKLRDAGNESVNTYICKDGHLHMQKTIEGEK